MLRIIQNSAPAGAKSYYSTADYYTQGQELTGIWRGRGAALLGLQGEVGKADWDALCDNIDPRTGLPLTVRQREGRRVGFEFNFNGPKSLSLLYGLTEDPRLLQAFEDAVDTTMQDMEAEMQTRVRVDGRDEDRPTGNMVWGRFVHTTARPVASVPDPHLHAHCFVFNATHDDQEGRWKAGQFAGLKRDAPYFEALYHARLARKLSDLGLETRRTQNGWELAGFDQGTLAKFSRRTAEIEAKALEKGITAPDKKGELGARTRSGKAKELSLRQLQDLWASRLSEEEGGALRAVAQDVGGKPVSQQAGRAEQAVSQAIEHCFERSSAVPERTLAREALRRAYGEASPERVLLELERRPLLRGHRHGRAYVTTKEVLAEEQAMVRFAREGRGTLAPLVPGDGHTFRRDWLGPDQRRAVSHVLNSRDRVTLIRGGAGTGKTSMMQETAEAIEAEGHRVFAFAPSATASRDVLRSEGFATADTVARLLLDEKLQAKLRGQVIWIDEAGLLPSRTTAQVFRLADTLDARLVLSGDKRQHGSVERGATLRLLEEEAGLVPAELREIHRQKADYKRAVNALSLGRTEEGYRELDRLGWVREVHDTERYRLLAADYVGAVSANQTALCVSPTHRESAWVTEEIRAELKHLGRIGRDERSFTVLANANLTEAQRQDVVNFEPGDVLEFHQNARGFTKGDRVVVGNEPLPLSQANRFQLFKPADLGLATGDAIRVTRNGTTADGKHRLNNGAVYQVRAFDPAGNIVLTNGWTIAREFGHIAHGYCVTSHASQGRTVDCVFAAQSTHSFPASSREQFYVTTSRGRNKAVIYTDDKEALLQAVSASDDRLMGTDLLRQRHRIAHQALTDTRTTPAPVRQRQEEKVRG